MPRDDVEYEEPGRYDHRAQQAGDRSFASEVVPMVDHAALRARGCPNLRRGRRVRYWGFVNDFTKVTCTARCRGTDLRAVRKEDLLFSNGPPGGRSLGGSLMN